MFYWQEFWLPLWNAAASRLPEAGEVFIHGYSMPDSDSLARNLLFDNISKSALVKIYCRSTSNHLEGEFHTHGFKHVEAYPAIRFEDWATA